MKIARREDVLELRVARRTIPAAGAEATCRRRALRPAPGACSARHEACSRRAVHLVHTLDVEDEDGLLARMAGAPHVARTPGTPWFVAALASGA